jgi:CDP-glucose 4,6-dehydratase
MEKVDMTLAKVDPAFWWHKKIFLTGHSGFKGGWLSLWLASMGAKVTGYALPPNTKSNLFNTIGINSLIEYSQFADIRDLDFLHKAIANANPDIVIHMAAQPLVRYSYDNPVETYATNVMGTVNVLEAIRATPSVRSVVIVTTDKCYENHEQDAAYCEEDGLGGFDPYSSSKGCAELVTAAYRRSFFSNPQKSHAAIASARAGNVIGGGDWSADRLIPDAIHAFEAGKPLMIRNPSATRPWQHVLEPLSGYLVLAQELFAKGDEFASAWNFGPHESDARSVGEVINLLIKNWNGSATWAKEEAEQPHEAHILKLDCTKARQRLNWAPKWNLEVALEKTVEWQKALEANVNMREFTLTQINQYINS